MSAPGNPDVKPNDLPPGSAPTGNRNLLIIGGIAGGVVVLVLGGCVCCGIIGLLSPDTEPSNVPTSSSGSGDSSNSKSKSATTSTNRYLGITDEGYAAIKTGMTESEVEAIIGRSSNVNEFESGNFVMKTAMYGDILSRSITVIYQNGKVSSKSKDW